LEEKTAIFRFFELLNLETTNVNHFFM